MLVMAERVEGHVGLITLNRPEVRNAIGIGSAGLLESALDAFDADPAVHAVVLTGAGGYFCAGGDLNAISEGRDAELHTERGGFAGIINRQRALPVVAAVEGGAVGGGLEILLACDLIVASRRARFALPEVQRGLVPASGGMFRIGRRLPAGAALRMLITGDFMSAERAYTLGLVDELSEPGSALEDAVALARRIARQPPAVVRILRETVDATRGASDTEAWRLSEQALIDARAEGAAAEGIAAFLERRQPRWS